MELLFTLSIFIFLVIIGSFLNNFFPKIPAALFQIILGVIITFIPIKLSFSFESETFLALVVAPLLFTDAFKASRSKLWMYKKPILLMAVGLVLVTVLVVGTFIDFMIPSITLSAAFALAAILSPTDAVAVKSITKGMKLPKGLMSILEGESLLNDAAGLVSFNIAIGTILTGTFSLSKATQNFLIVALGGAILGLICGILLSKIRVFFNEISGEETIILVIFQILTPILVYFIAEHLHLSGIVAVVITGIVFNFEKDLFQNDSLISETSVRIENNQSLISYILNGFVFVFLGYLLPDIYKNMISFPELDIKTAISYTFIITLSLMIVRFLFTYTFYVKFQQHSFSTAKKISNVFINRKLDVGNYSKIDYALITSLCGIHGTVTLATALMIPLSLSNGEIFPQRNAILFIASGVVLLSMIIGTIFLPLLIKSTVEEEYLEQNNIKETVIKETIAEVKASYNEEWSDSKKIAYGMIIKNLMEQQIYYNKNKNYLFKEVKRIYHTTIHQENKKILEISKNIDEKLLKSLLLILRVTQFRRSKLISHSLTNQLILQLRLSFMETTFKYMRARYYISKEYPERFNNKRSEKNIELNERLNEIYKVIHSISNELLNISTKIITGLKTEKNTLAADFVLEMYKNFTTIQFKTFIIKEKTYEEEFKNLQMEVIQLQKYRIMTMKKLNHIKPTDADRILRDLNYSEALLFITEE